MHQLKNIYLEITLFDFCSNREYYKTVFHFFIFIAAIISWLKIYIQKFCNYNQRIK